MIDDDTGTDAAGYRGIASATAALSHLPNCGVEPASPCSPVATSHAGSMAGGFAARALAIAVLVSVGGCTSGPDSNCKPDPPPSLHIDTSAIPLGVVTTEGACTQPRCTEPVGSGCTHWVGDMTSTFEDDHCTVILDAPDGRRLTRFVVAHSVCGAPPTARLTFP